MERTALLGRLTWQLGTVVATRIETARTKSLTIAVPQWTGHRPGQHVDVRLTAEDGYQAERSYSIASAPEDQGKLTITVERLEDGEVSPYLVDALLRTGTVYHPPETRQDQEVVPTRPHGARPQRHRRTLLAPSAC